MLPFSICKYHEKKEFVNNVRFRKNEQLFQVLTIIHSREPDFWPKTTFKDIKSNRKIDQNWLFDRVRRCSTIVELALSNWYFFFSTHLISDEVKMGSNSEAWKMEKNCKQSAHESNVNKSVLTVFDVWCSMFKLKSTRPSLSQVANTSPSWLDSTHDMISASETSSSKVPLTSEKHHWISLPIWKCNKSLNVLDNVNKQLLICTQGKVVPDRPRFRPFSCSLDPNRDQIESQHLCPPQDKFGW